MAYEYKCPTERGYKQIILTKDQHNEIFKYRKIKWFDKYEYYYTSEHLLVRRFYNWKIVSLSVVLLPLTLLLEGFANYKEIFTDIKKLFNQKKYGKFFSDVYYKDKNAHERVKELVIGCKVKFIRK